MDSKSDLITITFSQTYGWILSIHELESDLRFGQDYSAMLRLVEKLIKAEAAEQAQSWSDLPETEVA